MARHERRMRLLVFSTAPFCKAHWGRRTTPRADALFQSPESGNPSAIKGEALRAKLARERTFRYLVHDRVVNAGCGS